MAMILAVLQEKPRTATELLKITGLSKGVLYSHLKRLLKKEWIEKVYENGKLLIRINPKLDKDDKDEIKGLILKWKIKNKFERMDPDEILNYIDELEKRIDNLQAEIMDLRGDSLKKEELEEQFKEWDALTANYYLKNPKVGASLSRGPTDK